MARNSPKPSEKIIYFLIILLGILILYTDINTKKFVGIKNNLYSLQISSSFIFNRAIIESFSEFIEIFKSKEKLIIENNLLKDKLEESYLKNYIISKENSFFTDHNSLINSLRENRLNGDFFYAKLRSVDPNMFSCCDKHRLFLEIIDEEDQSFEESVVLNSTGLVGQIIDSKSYQEVMLLTDIKSSIPLIDSTGDFYCNAKGGGKAGYIFCTFSQLVWTEKHEINDPFFSSGLGGIYPKNIKIGHIASINTIDSTSTVLKIELINDPLKDNLFGVLKM